jgi:amino acid efflux transporter
MRATSALFIAVYVTATAAGNKLLEGAPRIAARVAFVAVLLVFAFSGAYILVPLAMLALTKVALSRRSVGV